MGLKDDLNEVQRLAKILGKDLDSLTLTRLQEDAKYAKELISDFNSEIKIAAGLSDDLASPFRAIQDEIKKGSQTLKDFNKSIGSFKNLAQKVQDIKTGTLKIDKEGLEKLKEKLSVESSILSSINKNLQARQSELQLKAKANQISNKELTQLQSINGALMESNAIIEKNSIAILDLDSSFERVEQTSKKINKSLGALPAIAGGVDKALKKAGMPTIGFQKAREETERLGQLAEENNKKFSSSKTYIKQLGNNFGEAFSKSNLIQGSVVAIITGLLSADKATEELARGLGMSMDAAHEMRLDFGDIANSSNNINITTKAVQESQMAMGKSLGTRAALNAEDLETMTNMVKTMGFQHDELVGLEKLSLSQGKSLKSNTNEILGGARAYASRNKLVVNEKEILKEVSNASASLKLSLGGSAQAVAEAAVQAKKFGINLEQAEKIAGSLLDFESSIESELSAELLTGKDLNLEKARGLALAGKSIEAAAAMLEQVGSSAEFGEMNVLQQQEIAKAMGMQKDELAASLIESEALAAMNAKEGQSALEAYNLEIAKGKSKEDMIKMLGEEAAENLEAQSNQSKFNAMVEKLKGIFIQVGDTLMPIFDMLGSIAEVIIPAISVAFIPIKYILESISGFISGNFETLSSTQMVIGGIATALIGVVSIMKIYNALQTAINIKKRLSNMLEAKGKKQSLGGAIIAITKGAWSALGPIPFIGAALAVAAVVGGIASLMSSSKKGDDVFSPGKGGSGYGNRTLMGPEGAISLNNKDTVIAGTNLFGDDVKSEGGKPTEMGSKGEIKVKTEGGVNMTQTNALLQQLISAVNAGGSINIDGQKVGEALKLGTYKTQ
jgi:hypothetical protein